MARRPAAWLTSVVFVLVALAGCFGGSGEMENRPPLARASVSQGSGALAFVLDASASSDPDGDPLTYHWNWAIGHLDTDEPVAEIELPAHVSTGATFPLTLTVRDGRGGAAFALDRLQIGSGVNNDPEAMILPANRWVAPGTEVVLDAQDEMTRDPDGDALSYEWIFGPATPGYAADLGHPEDPCSEVNHHPNRFNSGCHQQGENITVTFDQPGVIDYHCHPHPWMVTTWDFYPDGPRSYPVNTSTLLVQGASEGVTAEGQTKELEWTLGRNVLDISARLEWDDATDDTSEDSGEWHHWTDFSNTVPFYWGHLYGYGG